MGKMLFGCLICICSISLGRVAPEPFSVFEEIFRTAQRLNATVKMDTKELYSPVMTRGCLLSVYKCFVNQSSLLEPMDHKRENDFNITVSRLEFSLRNVNFVDTDTNCHSCYTYKLQPPKKFLENFLSFLQRLNRKYLGKRRTTRHLLFNSHDNISDKYAM